jgi:hypothetical protein
MRLELSETEQRNYVNGQLDPVITLYDDDTDDFYPFRLSQVTELYAYNDQLEPVFNISEAATLEVNISNGTDSQRFTYVIGTDYEDADTYDWLYRWRDGLTSDSEPDA